MSENIWFLILSQNNRSQHQFMFRFIFCGKEEHNGAHYRYGISPCQCVDMVDIMVNSLLRPFLPFCGKFNRLNAILLNANHATHRLPTCPGKFKGIGRRQFKVLFCDYALSIKSKRVLSINEDIWYRNPLSRVLQWTRITQSAVHSMWMSGKPQVSFGSWKRRTQVLNRLQSQNLWFP